MSSVSRASLAGLCLALALLLAVAASQRTTRAQDSSPEPDGARVYARACSVCHGQDGEGRIGPQLAGNLNLARHDYLTAIILRGRDGMPPFHDRLSGSEIEAVGEYVRSAWGNDFEQGEGPGGGPGGEPGQAPGGEPAAELLDEAGDEEAGDDEEISDAEAAAEPDTAGGQDLVAQWWQGAETSAELYDGVCARCHGAEGGGGFGPAFVSNDNLRDEQYLVGKILHGQGGMPAFEGLLGNEQIAAVASYIRNTFSDGTGSVGLETVLALGSRSPRENSGSLLATVFPTGARLSIIGPDRFVHFVSPPAAAGPTQLAGLLPGTYTVTGTKEGYRTAVAEVPVLPRRQSRVTLDLQVPAVSAAAEDRSAAAAEQVVQVGILPPPSDEVTGRGPMNAHEYRRSCALCHGPTGQGGIGPPLAANPNLQNAQYVLDRVLHGSGRMPSFDDRLSDEQIAAIVTHERVAWGNGFGEVTEAEVASQRQQPNLTGLAPSDIAAGDAIYEAYCSTCHGGFGQGGVGPALQRNSRLSETPFVVSRIIMGGGGMPSFHPVLSTAEIAQVASFIRGSWGNDFGAVPVFQAQNYYGGASSLSR